MLWKRMLMLASALIALAVLAWLVWPPARDVDTAQVQLGAMQVTVDDLGETRSRERLQISAPVSGRLQRIELLDGDTVTENQLLAQIAPLPLSVREIDELSARVAAAEALQREAGQRVRQAQTDLAQARRELVRVRQLAQAGFVAPQATEQARDRELGAASALEAARFRARAAAADVRAARAGLGATRAGSDGAAQPVPVRAPIAGRILRIDNRSERVVMAGAPLLTLGKLDALEIVVELLSSEAVRVAPGMPVWIDGWGGEQALRAQVRRVEPHAFTKVSALGIEEKRVNVIADFVDPPGPIGDGFRVNARIVVWQADQVLKLPASALFRCAAAWCVFVVEGGRARQREITLGQRSLVEAEVTAGLTPGQAVVRYPSNELTDGQRVQLRPSKR